MSVSVALPAFLAGTLVSLVAALAADAPEITAAVAAMAGRQQQIGAGPDLLARCWRSGW